MKRLTIFLTLVCVCSALINAQPQPNAYCKADTIPIFKDTCDFSLVVFSPVNCIAKLTATRPDSNDKNCVFAAPAAFTAKNYKDIVGKFAGIDTVITNPTENETGFCLLNMKDIYIGSIEDSLSYFDFALKNKNACYFQQMLLVSNSKIVECLVFGKQKPTFRRALCKMGKRICVIESLNRMDIGDFSAMLIEAGVSDAIYLDMGTWSEGYFKDRQEQTVQIGKLKQNTRYQTNWIVFVKEL